MPDTKPENPPALPELFAGKLFLCVCSGEQFDSWIVEGHTLWETYVEAIYGGDEDSLSEADMARDKGRLLNPDSWSHDPELGPTRYREDVGETDQIQFILITDSSLVSPLRARNGGAS